MVREPMTKQEVIDVIERKSTNAKIPLGLLHWWGDGLIPRYGFETLESMANNYPIDVVNLMPCWPGEDVSSNGNPRYRFGYRDDYNDAERHSIGASPVLLPDWDELDRFLEDFPDPNEPGVFDEVHRLMPTANGRYVVGHFWRLFHERFWSIRGMENLMMDYYDNMDGLKAIGNKCLEFYKVMLDRFADAGVDGILTSDDLGHQAGPMMSPAIFEELYLPLYKEFISYAHSKNMHVFLHSCGDNTLLMPYLIEAGLDVFHPIQAGCMDFKETAERYGDQISFLAGFDVQHLLPDNDTEGVRRGIRDMIDALYKPQGGLLIAPGNGIMGDTCIENIETTFYEISTYIPKK